MSSQTQETLPGEAARHLPHADAQRLTQAMKSQGYVVFKPTLDSTEVEALEQLRSQLSMLPKDPHAASGRYRWLGKAVLLRGEDIVHWVPDEFDSDGNAVCTYVQEMLNPQFPGVLRQFPALPGCVKSNVLLTHQILRDRALTFWEGPDAQRHLHVHVHVIALRVAGASDEARPSPPYLHRDGEPFTFVHLIKRDNVAGGVNALAPPEYAGRLPHQIPGELLAEFELTSAFESYGVVDAMVSHHVGGVRALEAGHPADRSVVLIDFTPLVPQLVP